MIKSVHNIDMSKPNPGTYPNRIGKFIEKTEGKITQNILADACGVTQPTINALIQGQTQLRIERAQIISPILQCKWWELSDELESTYKSMNSEFKNISSNNKALQTMISNVIGDHSFGPDTVPILGQVNGSSEAIVLNLDEPIGEAPRHPHQKGIKNAFALYVKGESMTPRLMSGELIYAIMNRPPLSNQDCVIEMKNNGESYVKQFIKTTDKEIICRQFNPLKEWRRLLTEVKAMHAIVGRG